MKLYWQGLKLLFSKFILRKENGAIIKVFAEKMGVVYIKFAQILATHNYGNLFTEKDRELLSSICDDCNPIEYDEIEEILKEEFGDHLNEIFQFIEKTPVGSASVSQVHKATLINGEEVAIKIRRKDITKTIEKDIKRIKKIVHRFGKFVKFGNYTGGDKALDLYLEWIRQETDFHHEVHNIKLYQNFADNVNGKVPGTKKIKVPKLYEDYCSENIIVMEFINTPTVNKMNLSLENKDKIVTALNSYIKLSFWALFHDQSVVFHGDPHSGNIVIDEEGNICFLDLGLAFELQNSELELCRNFYLTAYSGDAEKFYQMLIPYGKMSEEKKNSFKRDCEKYCQELKEKEVTYYFVDMINICLKYEFVPPNFLFCMAKAFICLNGISNFTENKWSAHELLKGQTMEFFIQRSMNDCKKILADGIHFVPKTINHTLKYGIASTLAEIFTNSELKRDAIKSLEHVKEVLEIAKNNY